MSTKYVDVTAIVQVIGNIYNKPSLLENDKYHFNEEDFPNDFHKIIFGSIYNLHALGAEEINYNTIEDYLKERPKKLAIFKANDGVEYLKQLGEIIQPAAFDYYYNRLKKFTLLRMYHEQAGLDLTWLYDVDNIFDEKKKEQQESWLDNTPLEKIADAIDDKIQQIKTKYVENAEDAFTQAGEGIDDLINQLMEFPEIGYPLHGDIFNSITRGARLGKLYLRSGATGTGKTRALIADACTIGCTELYNLKTGQWENNGTKEGVLFISTELGIDEVQTMMLAFVSCVNEDHIINNNYYANEIDRVRKAAQILKESGIQIRRLPDFGLEDIEKAIRFSIREYGVKYIIHDYLHTSMKILSEVSGKSRVEGLKEYNVLFMIAVRLKDLAVEYGIFIETATQLNSEYRSAQVYDQNLLRGAKSIADKIDLGEIMLEASQEDVEALSEFCTKNGFEIPQMKVSVYKNRRGRYKDILVWCSIDRGICHFTPMFVTDYNYEIVNVPALKINVIEGK